MLLKTTVNGIKVQIDLPGVSLKAYRAIEALLDDKLSNPSIKNREAIAVSFLNALKQCPQANASDLWHHVVYRLYCAILPRYRPQDPKQSWVRAGGDALEMTLEQWYSPILNPHGIKIKMLIGAAEKKKALADMGIQATVGAAKLDMTLHLDAGQNQRVIFGGVHVKASLAERVSDDIPASRAMMAAGYFSPLWTLDVKSFPPPRGDLINRGEFGSLMTPSEKRRYVEEHGEFHACYTANSRSIPSIAATPSGRRIYAINLSIQPDQFAQDVIAWADTVRQPLLLG
ncbi:MAG TPA: BsaWI family type II restriction enzyme [Pyrinomonadaceae bacterium]|nr:BsaWI family type II restriction enzyme [Pyrinomonadaceae bacterium]